MDQLPSFGTAIFPALMPTMEVYAGLHEKNRASIESTPREELLYGSDPRQKLDLYTPTKVTDDTPIFVFLYGGGLSRGDKRMPSPPTAEGLVYANIGHYFTSRGFITVIPDYRRTSEGAQFPSGGEDIAAIVAWLKSRYNNGSHKLYIMGNSAGAVHTATWLLEAKFAESRASVKSGSLSIQGTALISIPAQFKLAGEGRSETLQQYYGSRIQEDCAFGLLERVNAPEIKTLVVTGTLDPDDEILEPSNDFVKLWQSRFEGSNLTVKVLEGHNHFSTAAGLGTGIEREESLGAAVLEWIGK